MDRATNIVEGFHSAVGALAGVHLQQVTLPPSQQLSGGLPPKEKPAPESTSKFGALPMWEKVAIVGGSALALAGIVYGVRYAIKHGKSAA